MRISDDEVPRPGPDGVTTLPATFNVGVSLTRVSVLAAGMAVIGVLTWRSGGFVLIALALSVLVVFGLRAWVRSRVAVRLDARSIRVQSVVGERVMDADDIVKVTYVFNGRSPDIRLVPAHGRGLIVPTSQVAGGHAVVFRWLAGAAPGSSYDSRADDIRRAVRDHDLRRRGR